MSGPGPDPEPERPLESVERENRLLARKLARLQTNARQLEEAQDANSRLLTRLVHELEVERARSRDLLLNILPQDIVTRLESGETQIADRYESVTVLFSDFVGFTRISATLPVATLVAELNDLFSEFDELCGQARVEKIKTIGDAYLAVGGLPGTREDHTVAVAETALAMLEAVARVNARTATGWRMRVGIHMGPAVAGVIGSRKFVYDVWGDTVNVASRLETTSEPGRIQVSEPVAEALREAFDLEPRGTVELKGKGETPTHFLLGRRE